jgi:hypothetical protein
MTDDTRKSFEAAYVAKHPTCEGDLERGSSTQYLRLHVQTLWEGYQLHAASSQPVVQGFCDECESFDCVCDPQPAQGSEHCGEVPQELLHRWAQESTIEHHITADHSHVLKRNRYIAQKAIEWDRQTRPAQTPIAEVATVYPGLSEKDVSELVEFGVDPNAAPGAEVEAKPVAWYSHSKFGPPWSWCWGAENPGQPDEPGLPPLEWRPLYTSPPPSSDLSAQVASVAEDGVAVSLELLRYALPCVMAVANRGEPGNIGHKYAAEIAAAIARLKHGGAQC